jgi:glutaredoxin
MVILYTGPGCKLCNDAEQLLFQAGLSNSQIEKVDVTSSLDLKKRYGLKIPVLQRQDSGRELYWPFEIEELISFLT